MPIYIRSSSISLGFSGGRPFITSLMSFVSFLAYVWNCLFSYIYSSLTCCCVSFVGVDGYVIAGVFNFDIKF